MVKMMNQHTRSKVSALVIAFSMFLMGVNIVTRGNIWNLVLGKERYLVGGVAIMFGIYIVLLVLKKNE